MRRVFAGLAAGLIGLSAPAASAIELKLVPSDRIDLNLTNPRGYADFVLHTIALATSPRETVAIDDIQIDVLKGGAVVLTKHLSAEGALAATSDMTSPANSLFLPYQLLNAGGPNALFGRKVTAATGSQLGPSQYLLAARQHFSVDFQPDMVRVTIAAHDDKGGPVTASAELPIGRHKSPIAYQLPLNGVWSMNSLPSIESHHRLNPDTEFAVDFFKVDATGSNYSGDNLVAENWYAYGAPVLAAADGIVVSAKGSLRQDRTQFAHKPGEDAGAYGARLEKLNSDRFKKNFGDASAGNIIVLRHEAEGVVEYSSYGHLKTGSVTVKPGDHVSAGQQIAEVGDTGDSPVVHLHFQLNAGPDPFLSKTLPIKFANMRFVGASQDPGRFITSTP